MDVNAAEVARPVVLVQGADSGPVLHRLVAHLAGLLPQATVQTIENAGHLMPLTAPATLAALISRVTDAVVAGRGVDDGQRSRGSRRS